MVPEGIAIAVVRIGNQHHVPFDIFGSMKMTAVVALVGAACASPIVLKGDALASVGHRLAGEKGHQVEVETVSAGG